MLDQLKAKHAELISDDNIQCGKIGMKMEAYSKMFTESIDLRGLDLKPLSETDSCKVYQLRINSLKAKKERNLLILQAIKDGNDELVKALDLFESDERVKRYWKSNDQRYE